MDNMKSAVPQLVCGDWLENFIDHLCCRQTTKVYPEWMTLDPRFMDLFDEDQEEPLPISPNRTTTEASNEQQGLAREEEQLAPQQTLRSDTGDKYEPSQNMLTKHSEVNVTLRKPHLEADRPEVWVSLFDGIGCGAMAGKPLDPKKDKYIGVECSASRRHMADYANPPSATFPGITRELGHDVMAITRQMIKDVGPIRGMKAGWPCKNLSWLRTRTGQDGRKPKASERSGLKGADSGKCVASGRSTAPVTPST